MNHGHELPGHGVQIGPLLPDWGAGFADLKCDRCGAGWTGQIGEECDWCQRDLDQLVGDQRRQLLRPGWLPDPDDARYPGSLYTWVRRLARAVYSGLITPAEAEAATRRVKAKQ